MKKIVYLLFILALAIPVVIAAARSDSGLHSGQKPSGKITIYTSMYEDVISSMEEILKERFLSCDVNFVYGSTSQIQAMIATEQGTGKLGCDILLVAEPSYSLELKEKGLLHHYTSAEAGNIAFNYDREGYWYPVRVSNMVLAYNPEKTKKSSVPDSFYGFAYNAGLRGAVSMSNPLISGTAMTAAAALRDKYSYGYFDALGKQKVAVEASSIAITKLESGEYKEIMVLEESILKKRQEGSTRLEIIYPKDGAIVIPSTIMIIAGKWSANNNTRSAEKIADWFLSPQGQLAIVDGGMHSVRKDFELVPGGSIPTSWIQIGSMPLNWENVFRQRDEIQARFEEFVIFRR